MGYISHWRQHLLEIARIARSPQTQFLTRRDHVLLLRAPPRQMGAGFGKKGFWRGNWGVVAGSQGCGVTLCLPFVDSRVSAMARRPSPSNFQYGDPPHPHGAARASPLHRHPYPAPGLHTRDCDCPGASLPCVGFVEGYVLPCGRFGFLSLLVCGTWQDYLL